MKERSFDEMIAYFNRRVSEMDIAQDYKIELLGMVTALGYKHEQTARRWIPCSERLPEDETAVLVCTEDEFMYLAERTCGHWEEITGFCSVDDTVAWMPLPEPYKEEDDGKKKVFSFEAEPYKEGGKIQLITNDEEMFRQVRDYISTLVDAENYRRQVRSVTAVE